MAVKILHAADFHMDSAFDSLPEEKAVMRRKEQRDMLFRIAETANIECVDVVLLSGDLFDSGAYYHDTCKALIDALGSISAEVFIAPGNHDYFSQKSPYSFLKFPENVHIFKSPIVSSYTIPELGCRIYGAGFNAPRCPSLLEGFAAEDNSYINIMTVHGDLSGELYNYISESAIRNSRLDYLALGHIHAYSGINRLGNVTYAYPGCPEGRGFDELGEKGVIIGTVEKGKTDLHFVPLGGREYKIYELDMTGKDDAVSAVKGATTEEGDRKNVVRVILRGIYSGKIDIEKLYSAVSDRFFHVVFRDETRLGIDIWDGMNEDTLTGLFLKRMRAAFEAAETAEEREKVNMAVRFGLAAIENREEWRP